MQSEIIKNGNENENSSENDEALELEEIVPIHTNCQVCNSGRINEIHKLRASHTLVELSEVLKKKYNLELSKDALSNHFIRYREDMKNAVARKLYENFRAEVNAVADHQRKVLYLANVSFDHILNRLASGTLVFGLDDFGKLVNLYHSVIKNPGEAGDENILEIYKRASEKYGCKLDQTPLPLESPKGFGVKPQE